MNKSDPNPSNIESCIDLKAFYKLALLVQNNSKYERLAKLLVSSLGLPQVGVYVYQGTLPSVCEAFILFGEKEWCARIKNKKKSSSSKKKIFIPTEGYICKIENASILKDTNNVLELPQKITHKYVPAKPHDQGGIHHTIRLSLYYTLKFLKKSALCQVSDRVYALFLSYLVFPLEESFCHDLLTSIFAKKDDLFDGCNDLLNESILSKGLNAAFDLMKKILPIINTNKVDDNCKIFLFYVSRYLDNNFRDNQFGALIKNNPYHKAGYLEQRINKAKAASHLAYYGCIAFFENNADLVNIAKKRILEELYNGHTCYIKSSTSGTGFCYSPLLSIFLLLTSDENILKKSFPITQSMEVNFDWHVLNKTSLVRNKIETHSFFDMDKFEYSESLIENLEKALFLPIIPDGYQYEISQNNYSVVFLSLQEIWTEFIKHCIHMLEDYCVVLSPWPEQKKFALSIRYDVDRPVTQNMIFEIFELQRKYTEKSWATWFFFIEDTNEEQKNLLKSHFQEVGLHAVSNEDILDNALDVVGITYHCGPNSSYWPGKRMFITNNNKTKYTEFLSMQVGKPTLCFLEDFINATWVTPLHFPMEKGTQLINEVEYSEHFDKINLLTQLHGHIILGSHPDIDQRHLKTLLEKIDISTGWLATIGEVVERCIQILNYGNFYIPYQSEDGLSLYSKHSIQNLQIKIIFKNGSIQRRLLDINAFELKEISFQHRTCFKDSRYNN